MPPQQIDFDALAKQHGGIDYDALAAQVRAPAPPQKQADSDPNTFATFLHHAWQQVNPFSALNEAGQTLPWPKALGGGGLDAPMKAYEGFHQAQDRVYQEAEDAWKRKDYLTAVRKGSMWLSSVATLGASLGLDKSSDDMQAGKYAAALGDALGMAGAVVAPEVAGQIRRSAPMARVATRAEQAADTEFTKAMSPKGSSKPIQRTAKQAAAVATDVRRGTTAITPEGLHAQIADRLGDAGENLDAAYAAIPKTKPYATRPILQKLQAARDSLRVSGIRGSVTSSAVAARAAALDQAIDEVKQLGSLTTMDSLTKLRNQWQGPARNAFVPELNPNFEQIRGNASGWADAWGALQEAITDQHPNLRPLNADYRVWKQASDVMEALADQQRTKPTVGRTIMAQGIGATTGGIMEAMSGSHSGAGVAIGAIVAPLVERGFATKLAPAIKLTVARELGKLADAIRTGQPTVIESALGALRPLVLSTTATRAAAPAPVQMIPAHPVGKGSEEGAGRPPTIGSAR